MKRGSRNERHRSVISQKEEEETEEGGDCPHRAIEVVEGWCLGFLLSSVVIHSPMAIISLCLLAQIYQHASGVIQSLVEEDINTKFLVQLDKLIRLLETPIFAYLRLQLLDPGRYTWLLKALYGLLMLLPQQSATFKILRMRPKTVSAYSFGGEQVKKTASGNLYSQSLHHMPSSSQVMEDGDASLDVVGLPNGINFTARHQQFEHMQHQHRTHSKSQLQLHFRNPSSSSKEMHSPGEPVLSLTSIHRPPSRSTSKGEPSHL